MHELSLCHSIVDIVERARGERQVLAVELQVGQLRQVVPQTLEYCWGLVTAEGPLAGAELVIDHVPVALECLACGETTVVEHALVLTCGACGAGEIRLLRGEEFMVTSLRVATATAPGAPASARTSASSHAATTATPEET